jgi:hypothetical protein
LIRLELTITHTKAKRNRVWNVMVSQKERAHVRICPKVWVDVV